MFSLIIEQIRLAKLAFLLWLLVLVKVLVLLVLVSERTQMAWADRKVAQGIPARSARDIPVAGRFAPLPMPSAFQYLCGFYKTKTLWCSWVHVIAVCSRTSAPA